MYQLKGNGSIPGGGNYHNCCPLLSEKGSRLKGKNTLIVHNITKTCLYNFDPLKPHFYIVKLGFTRVFFLFLLKNIDCGYSLEPPLRGGSKEYPQSMFWAEIWKISEFLLSGNFQFLVVKFSICLNRRVFVMSTCIVRGCPPRTWTYDTNPY